MSSYILVATIVQAIAMVVLVVITCFYAVSTNRIAKATEKSVETTEKMIKQVEKDRVYRIRPIVVPLPGYRHSKDSVGVHEMTFEITNIGTGPALNLEAECVLANFRMKGTLPGLAPGDHQEIKLSGKEPAEGEAILILVYNNIKAQSYKTVSEVIGDRFRIRRLEMGDITQAISKFPPKIAWYEFV